MFGDKEVRHSGRQAPLSTQLKTAALPFAFSAAPPARPDDLRRQLSRLEGFGSQQGHSDKILVLLQALLFRHLPPRPPCFVIGGANR